MARGGNNMINEGERCPKGLAERVQVTEVKL